MQRVIVGEKLEIRLYDAHVLPVLRYNCGTWAMTSAVVTWLDPFNRKQLHSLTSMTWPQQLLNEFLYQH